MSVEAKLRLQIREFTQNYDAAKSHAVKRNEEMERSAGGVGGKLAAGFDNAKATIAGMVSVGAVIAGIKASLQEAQEMSNLSTGLNESVEGLSRVSFAAKALGMDFMTVAELGRELEDRLGDLGNAEPVEVMNRLGLSIEELMAMPLDQKLATIAGAFDKARGDGVAYSDLLKLLGDSVGEQLLPLLGQGKEALEAMFAEAPERSAEMVNSMARMNEELNKGIEGLKGFGSRYVGSILGVAQVLKDAVATGSIEDALLMEGDRQVDFAKRQAGNAQMAKAKAEAIAAAREAETATAAETKAAEKLKGEMEKLAELKDKLADGGLDLLPDDQKIDALKAKLTGMLGETVGLFSLNFETSTKGLEDLAKAREANKDLPSSGQNSAAEAYGWLEEARKLEADIAKTEEKIAADKKKAADEEAARQKELIDLRATAEEGRVGLLSEEDQTKAMRDKLGASLGVKITGMADIERGLQRLRANADIAAINGDPEAEAAAQRDLIEAQKQAAAFQQRIAGDGGPGKQGEFQTLVDEIFNRDPAAEQLRALEEGLREQRESRDLLDSILKKMDEPVPRDTFSDFGA